MGGPLWLEDIIARYVQRYAPLPLPGTIQRQLNEALASCTVAFLTEKLIVLHLASRGRHSCDHGTLRMHGTAQPG